MDKVELRSELDAEWAARPVILARRKGRTMLVLEDSGGTTLDRFLGQPLELTRFLPLAISLAVALGKLHERGLIHKDINPGNVLVDFATGHLWLTGFGIASRLPRERQASETPEIIAGTLAYMAPEQTGRMNRSIDSRSDLYSYGVILYEMLTGAPPFTASDPMEWIHCHIARQPLAPAERLKAIPGQISAIVMKLLAKTAEERYQTAAGVEADLRKCLSDWESFGHIDPFPLARQDALDRLLIPEKLYGRDTERKILLEAFDRVVTSGRAELVLVSGYSGIGKSSVVNELHKVIVLPRGIFISGKSDQHKRGIPYATLTQAYQGLVRQILAKSEEEVSQWRDGIRDAVDSNGQLMVNLIPELELVIGKQPPVPEIAPQEAQNRFDTVLRRFLGAFARKEHPLALFVDDLQWMDPASLKLLEQFVTRPDIRYLLLIGAYRDNEVAACHPLRSTLDAIRKTEAIVHEIVLKPLSLADMTELIGDALRSEPAHAHPLAKLVVKKTSGNPFFAIQFITTLAEERLLGFDAREAAWKWDVNRIRAKGFTDNVVDLMIRKLKRLPAATREALKQLACLGNRADLTTLLIVRGGSEEELHMELWEAVRSGSALRLGASYKFLHDRIQEAAYALIPEALRAQLHLRIGRLLITKMTPDEIAEHIFDIVNQLNSGLALISDPEEKARVAALNLCAGRRAKGSTAYASACIYLSAGMSLIGSDGLDRPSQYGLAFALCLERAECELLSGNFDEAERLIGQLVRKGASSVDKAAAYSLKVHLHLIKSEKPQGVDAALECLRLFGIEIPAHPTRKEVQAEYELIWRNLAEQPIESLVDLPLMTNPEMHAAMRVLAFLTGPALYTDINLYHLHFCKMVNLSLRYGISDASTFGYAGFGVMLCLPLQRYVEGYRFGKLACDLVEKHGFATYKAKVYLSMEMVALWTRPIEFGIKLVRVAFRAGAESGDLSFACYSCMHLITDLLIQGAHLDEVWRESETCLDFVRKGKYLDAADAIICQQQFIRNLRGRTANLSTFSDEKFDEKSFEARLTEDRMTAMVSRYWILKVQARFLSLLNQPAAVIHLLDEIPPIPNAFRSYVLGLGAKTLLVIPLNLARQLVGSVTFRFTEDREFRPEELEIARALASQASLAIQLTRLAKGARQSAVLEERNKLAGEIHDSLAQFLTGISLQLGAAKEVIKRGGDNSLSYVERATELAQFGLAEARRSAFSLQSTIIEELGLVQALQKLVDRSNIPGRLRCNFDSTGLPEESLPTSVQEDLLRIAQEALSNAVRHAKPTVINVRLRCDPSKLVLEVADNGTGIANPEAACGEGFGLSNMQARAQNLGAQLDVRTSAGRGTSIVVRMPINS